MNRYRVWIEDAARAELQRLPGNMRQRVARAIGALAEEPRPHNSRHLAIPADTPLELRRIRIDPFRIVYAIDEQEQAVGVYAIRRRPPYDYEDLARFVEGLSDESDD